MTARADVERALSTTPATSRQIWLRMGCWALVTVQHQLRALVAAGRVSVSSERRHMGAAQDVLLYALREPQP